MQFKAKQYDADKHEKFKALSVNQPYAGLIAAGIKTIELRKTDRKYRGQLLICSTVNPKTKEPGQTLAFVDLYATKKVSDLTPEELTNAQVSNKVLERFKDGYAWFLRNPKRVIEFPMKGQLGIFELIYTKDTIIEYPPI